RGRPIERPVRTQAFAHPRMCPRLCWRGAPVLAVKPPVSTACPIWAAWFRAYHRALRRYITRLLGRGRGATRSVHGGVVGLQYLFWSNWRINTTRSGVVGRTNGRRDRTRFFEHGVGSRNILHHSAISRNVPRSVRGNGLESCHSSRMTCAARIDRTCHGPIGGGCPLYPPTRTKRGDVGMSALCHKRSLAVSYAPFTW